MITPQPLSHLPPSMACIHAIYQHLLCEMMVKKLGNSCTFIFFSPSQPRIDDSSSSLRDLVKSQSSGHPINMPPSAAAFVRLCLCIVTAFLPCNERWPFFEALQNPFHRCCGVCSYKHTWNIYMWYVVPSFPHKLMLQAWLSIRTG